MNFIDVLKSEKVIFNSRVKLSKIYIGKKMEKNTSSRKPKKEWEHTKEHKEPLNPLP